MKAWTKLAGVCAALAVLGAGAAAVALKAFFPEPKVRALIVDGARKQLGREVRLDRLSLGLTGLHLSGLAVSERPDFAAGTFVSADSVSVRPSWRALLRKRLVIASASADGLKLVVAKGADGRFNYETLFSSAAAAAETGQASAAAEFDVRRLRLTRGAVDYRDAAGSWTISGLELALDGFSLSEPFDLDVSLRAAGRAGERPVDALLAFRGAVHPARFERPKMKLVFKRLSVEQDGLKLSARGTVEDLSAPKADLDAEVSAAGKTVLTVAGKARTAGAGADFDLALETPGLDTTLIAKHLPSAGVPAAAVPAARAQAAGHWEPGAASLKSFRVEWDGGKVEGEGALKDGAASGRAAFGVDVPAIRAGQYAFVKLPPTTAIPAMRLDGEAAYAGGDVTLKKVVAKLEQGTAAVTGTVKRAASAKPAPDLTVSLALTLPEFRVSELPVALSTAIPPDFRVPAMRLDGTVRVRGDDVSFEKVAVKGKAGSLRLDGAVAKALSGRPEPELTVVADLDLPALTEKDLPPLAAIPPGLELPPSKWDVDLAYTTPAIRLRRLGVKIGGNELSVEGGVSDPGGRGAFDLLLKCRKFVLDELTRITPRTRDLKLSGTGFFALSVTGTKAKPVFGGKLQFKDLGATVAELPLSGFTGTVSFDERRIDVPNLTGQVADGRLAMDLTIKDYARSPEIQVEASLDRFDLGKYQEARAKLDADRKAAADAKAARTGKAVEEKPAEPYRTRGKFEIGRLIHPNAQLDAVTAAWDLWGVTPDFKRLAGDAKLSVGTGRLKDVGALLIKSPALKIVLAPILVFQKIGFGVNLNDISVGKFLGDYAFKDGLMTVRQSELDSKNLNVTATGTVDLPTERLDMASRAQVGNLPAVEHAITGTIAAPQAKLKVGKLLQTAGENLLNGILRR